MGLPKFGFQKQEETSCHAGGEHCVVIAVCLIFATSKHQCSGNPDCTPKSLHPIKETANEFWAVAGTVQVVV